MTYELAKQLKEAGFLQNYSEHYFGWIEAHQSCGYDEGNYAHEKAVACPTLSELIEACGDKLLALQHTPFNPTMPIPEESMPKTWMALGGENRGTHFSYQQSGFTPEEAVANLWIALQTK